MIGLDCRRRGHARADAADAANAGRKQWKDEETGRGGRDEEGTREQAAADNATDAADDRRSGSSAQSFPRLVQDVQVCSIR